MGCGVRSAYSWRWQRQWGESASIPNRHGSIRDDPDDTVVDRAHDLAIMMQPDVGNIREVTDRSIRGECQRIAVNVAARHDQWTPDSIN